MLCSPVFTDIQGCKLASDLKIELNLADKNNQLFSAADLSKLQVLDRGNGGTMYKVHHRCTCCHVGKIKWRSYVTEIFDDEMLSHYCLSFSYVFQFSGSGRFKI
ncbi:hypothetical protein PanWU01x14_292190 [Parasponia andersonii]|uniref:Uncharacterized protein n=1 Tax=Parasponia andersonii TaxID=3476 RepID=A0A2P5AX90_PARAD|nr:hypothetical protein PanWU01x14_292190 [Parasponia andersonii]